MSHASRRSARLKDFALYIAISSIVIVFFLACVLNNVSFEWILVWIATAFIFISLIVVNRRQWGRSFWLFLAVVIMVHVLCLPSAAAGLSRLGHSAGRVVAAGSILEYFLLRVAGGFIVRRMSR
jgi:hypothetical protein